MQRFLPSSAWLEVELNNNPIEYFIPNREQWRTEALPSWPCPGDCTKTFERKSIGWSQMTRAPCGDRSTQLPRTQAVSPERVCQEIWTGH
jgi:hypothetical protein